MKNNPMYSSGLHRAAREYAEAKIREMDKEAKYVPDASYGLRGRILKEYIAQAYQHGWEDGLKMNREKATSSPG